MADSCEICLHTLFLKYFKVAPKFCASPAKLSIVWDPVDGGLQRPLVTAFLGQILLRKAG